MKRARGFSFTECVMAISLLMILLYGIAVVELSSLKGMSGLKRRQTAELLASDILFQSRMVLEKGGGATPLSSGKRTLNEVEYSFTTEVLPSTDPSVQIRSTAGAHPTVDYEQVLRVTVKWEENPPEAGTLSKTALVVWPIKALPNTLVK